MLKRPKIVPGTVDEQQLIRLLGRVESPMSNELYNAIAPIVPAVAVESVILRKVKDKTQVYLVQRPDNDAHWPREWHSPGTLLRASDACDRDPIAVALKRIEARELGIKFKTYRFTGRFVFHQTPRGSEMSLVYVCTVEEEPKVGGFFPVNELPQSLIIHQQPVIRIAHEAYMGVHE